jgi:ABC-type nickel/cobalt efflux system permease component RcnA
VLSNSDNSKVCSFFGKSIDIAVFVILKSKAKEAGIEDVSPHDPRRTFITSLFEAGNDIMFVAALGGLGIAVPAGVIPYPGAVAVIFFALSLHMLGASVLSVISISLRMGVTISVTGVIVILAKRGVVWALAGRHEERDSLLRRIIEIGGAGILLS